MKRFRGFTEIYSNITKQGLGSYISDDGDVIIAPTLGEDWIMKGSSIYVIGDEEYINSKIEELYGMEPIGCRSRI